MTEQRKNRLRRQLQEARARLGIMNQEFAAPLWEMLFVASKDVKRISTNGACIYFNPDWLQKLGSVELDFILSHELMHIALGHIERPKYYKGDRFHLACDIVANAHLEVFGWKYDRLPHIGRIFYETFFPTVSGRSLTAQEALAGVPFDPALMEPGVRRNYMIDEESWWDRKEDRGEGGDIVLSPRDEDPEDLRSTEHTIGGTHFFVEKERFVPEMQGTEDDELPQGEERHRHASKSSWDKGAANELQSLRSRKKRDSEAGEEVDFRERIWQRSNSPRLNWKKLLNRFIQEEVCDYSFTPPDRRLQDSDFFLPDYNVLLEKPKEVLFMVDTSGSIDDPMLMAVYNEICEAIGQFNGGLIGLIGFFDVRVYTPVLFGDVNDLAGMVPRGGGGTNFQCIFDYVKRHMSMNPPADIVIFTDGEAEYPEETEAQNIPVLWLFTNASASAPWGKSAVISVEQS